MVAHSKFVKHDLLCIAGEVQKDPIILKKIKSRIQAKEWISIIDFINAIVGCGFWKGVAFNGTKEFFVIQVDELTQEIVGVELMHALLAGHSHCGIINKNGQAILEDRWKLIEECARHFREVGFDEGVLDKMILLILGNESEGDSEGGSADTGEKIDA